MDERDAILRTLRDAAREALPSIYFDPSHYDLLAQMTSPHDVPFYLERLERYGGPVLEIGCGTGRVALELVRAGAEVVGVDLSESMLEAAHHKAMSQGLAVTLALGDMRSFDLERTFPLVLIPYNAFNHLLTDGDVTSCLATLRRHMSETSRLIIDTLNPSPTFLADDPARRRPILRYLDPYVQKEVVLSEEDHWNPDTGLNRIVWSYAVGGEKDARVDELTMRLFFPEDLDARVEGAGFAIEDKLGDHDGRAFDATSPRQLLICRTDRLATDGPERPG